MPPHPQSPKPVSIALLSAASFTQHSDNAGVALATAGGQPLLAHQISVLRHVGIDTFLIEVDTVPGALLALAGNVRKQGCSVEFIRSVEDLQKEIRASDQLLVQAEGLVASREFLKSVLVGRDAFIATVDGRDENEPFERMDLNTRWAGLAVLKAASVASLEPLPDGWNISSSLLRRAMQDRVPNRRVKQSNIQHGFLRKISSSEDAEQLTSQILLNRRHLEYGIIESRIFGPIATKLSPLIWRSPRGDAVLDGLMVFTGSASLVLAAFDFLVASIGSALFAIFLRSVQSISRETDLDHGIARWAAPVMWTMLAIATLIAGPTSAYQPFDGVFAAAMVIGLTLLARQLRLPAWAQKVLMSPALVVTCLLGLTSVTGFASALNIVALAQLGMLIIAKLKRKAVR